MESLNDFLHMGGYAKFVWTAYGVCTLGLVGVLWLSIKSWKANEREFGQIKSSRDQSGRDQGGS